MLKIFISAQLLLFCNCLLDNKPPSTVTPVDFKTELTNIWKEFASVEKQLRTATQERNSLQKQLTAANNEISALKQETSQCRKDIDEIRRNQTQISEEIQLLNEIATRRNTDIAFISTEITDMVQQQNAMKGILHNTTVQLAKVVSKTGNTSGVKAMQSQFHYLSLAFNDLQKNVSKLGLKIDDTSASVMDVNVTLKQVQDSERIIKNNSAAIAHIQDDMMRYKKTVSGIQPLDNSLVNSIANLNTTLQQQVALSKTFSSSLTNTTQQLGAQQNDLTRYDRTITSLQQSGTRLTNSLMQFNATMQKQLASTTSFVSFMSKTTQQLSDLQNLVAFSAYSTSTLNLAPYTTIRFEQTTLNVGQGYTCSNSSGVFTCPVDGYYVFTWTLQTKENHKLDSKIVRNGGSSHRYFNIDAKTSHSAAESNTEVMHLVTGDTVYIQGNGYFYGDWVSSFNGWKIV